MREITLVSKGCDSNPPFLSTNLNLYSKGKQSCLGWRGGQKPSLAKIMSQKGRVLVMEEEENN